MIPPPLVLVFAASDPTCGAGAQADALTLSALGCHPLTVLTGLTAQDTHGVSDFEPVPAHWVGRQAEVLLDDLAVAAVKIGVVGSAENAAAIAEALQRLPAVPLVLDPVLASGRGDRLADERAREAIRTLLVPRATVVTPNALEARALAGASAGARLEDCAQVLLEAGAGAVFVTGAHEPGADVVDVLYGAAGVLHAERHRRLPGEYHGSGCTLAAAITARLARGAPLVEAIAAASRFTQRALERAFAAGAGQRLPWRSAEAPA